MSKGFIACSFCPEDFKNGRPSRKEGAPPIPPDGVLRMWRDDATAEKYWIPPRGWSGSELEGPRPIVVAAFNPGAPHAGEPQDLRRQGVLLAPQGTAVSTRVARAVLENGTRQFIDLARNHHDVFHRGVLAYVRMVMWLLRETDLQHVNIDPLQDDWRPFAWITDVYKCSTLVEGA